MITLNQIYNSIRDNHFSKETLQLIDNYIVDILYGRTNLTQFNLHEHAGLCSAGPLLIGAYIVSNYARTSLETSADAAGGKREPTNWEIDELQEKLVQEWAKSKLIWFDHAEEIIVKNFGSKIAEGAESKVYYKTGETAVIKARTSIYATLGRALEAIILHNTFFPETPMSILGFTRDNDKLFRILLTQPYIGCKRLATKQEIDQMLLAMGFYDNNEGRGINYINDRYCLEDMHPANVFIDIQTEMVTCIDCIVKFKR